MSYSNLADIELLHLLQQKDEAAFEEIYNRFWKPLYTTSYNIIRDEYTAKDAVQEVFVDLWHRADKANIQVLKPYLQQAVRFQVLKCIRARKTDQQFYDRLTAITADMIYDNPLLFKEQEAWLRGILDQLPQDCKLVFTLSREERLTYKEIAGQLRLSEKTVEKKMSICLRHIRQRLDQDKLIILLFFMASQVANS